MSISLNDQYAALNSSARDLKQVAAAQRRSISQLSAGSRTVDPSLAGVEAGSVLMLRNSGLRLRALETGVFNAMSFLETQSGVFQQMASVVSRMSELATQMRDPIKNAADVSSAFGEFSMLQDELSSYRMSQFNGRNLMNYLSANVVEGALGSSPETLSVALSQEADSVLNITQSEISASGGPFNSLLGKITALTTPGRDSTGVTGVAELLDEAQWGQKGFDFLLEDISTRIALNQSEQSQLKMGLDRIRERMLGTEAATSRVADVDVAKELSVLARTDMQFRGAIATQTQSNVLADSALRILSNQDFSSPMIREARLATASTRSMVG